MASSSSSSSSLPTTTTRRPRMKTLPRAKGTDAHLERLIEVILNPQLYNDRKLHPADDPRHQTDEEKTAMRRKRTADFLLADLWTRFDLILPLAQEATVELTSYEAPPNKQHLGVLGYVEATVESFTYVDGAVRHTTTQRSVAVRTLDVEERITAQGHAFAQRYYPAARIREREVVIQRLSSDSRIGQGWVQTRTFVSRKVYKPRLVCRGNPTRQCYATAPLVDSNNGSYVCSVCGLVAESYLSFFEEGRHDNDTYSSDDETAAADARQLNQKFLKQYNSMTNEEKQSYAATFHLQSHADDSAAARELVSNEENAKLIRGAAALLHYASVTIDAVCDFALVLDPRNSEHLKRHGRLRQRALAFFQRGFVQGLYRDCTHRVRKQALVPASMCALLAIREHERLTGSQRGPLRLHTLAAYAAKPILRANGRRSPIEFRSAWELFDAYHKCAQSLAGEALEKSLLLDDERTVVEEEMIAMLYAMEFTDTPAMMSSTSDLQNGDAAMRALQGNVCWRAVQGHWKRVRWLDSFRTHVRKVSPRAAAAAVILSAVGEATNRAFRWPLLLRTKVKDFVTSAETLIWRSNEAAMRDHLAAELFGSSTSSTSSSSGSVEELTPLHLSVLSWCKKTDATCSPVVPNWFYLMFNLLPDEIKRIRPHVMVAETLPTPPTVTDGSGSGSAATSASSLPLPSPPLSVLRAARAAPVTHVNVLAPAAVSADADDVDADNNDTAQPSRHRKRSKHNRRRGTGQAKRRSGIRGRAVSDQLLAQNASMFGLSNVAAAEAPSGSRKRKRTNTRGTPRQGVAATIPAPAAAMVIENAVNAHVLL